jgi:hypothetical protein
MDHALRLRRPIYDPLGKYLGAFLFVVVGVTLLRPDPVVCRVLLLGIVGMCAASLASRSLREDEVGRRTCLVSESDTALGRLLPEQVRQ